MREGQSLSVSELSDMTGIEVGNILSIENGVGNTLLSELDKIASTLNSSLGELVKGV